MTTTYHRPAAPLTRSNRIGLGLAFALAVIDGATLAFPTPDGEEGAPLGILVLAGLLGVATVVLVVQAWRTGNRRIIRGIAGLRILSMISSLPAFFVDVPAGVKVAVAFGVLLTLTSVVLMLTPDRRTAPITD